MQGTRLALPAALVRALIALLGAWTATLAACASSQPAPPETWTVVSDFASPPFIYRDAAGEVHVWPVRPLQWAADALPVDSRFAERDR